MSKDPLMENEEQEAPKCPDCNKEMELVDGEFTCNNCDKEIDFFGDDDED